MDPFVVIKWSFKCVRNKGDSSYRWRTYSTRQFRCICGVLKYIRLYISSNYNKWVQSKTYNFYHISLKFPLSNPEMLNKCIDKGVTRLNISLDTLDKKKFSEIARQEEYVYDNVMDTIDIASKRLSLFKINMVVMNKNFNEIEDMLYFAQEKGAVLRLIELYPYGPAIESGKLNYDENHVSKNEIVEKLWNIGDLSETEVDGINAVPRYYKISGFERPIAIISLKSPMFHNFSTISFLLT